MKSQVCSFFFWGMFVLLFCCSCHQSESKTEVMLHYEGLSHAVVTNDTSALRREQRYMTDTLSSDTLLKFPRMHDYLCTWTNSYIFSKHIAKVSSPGSSVILAVDCLSSDVKRLAIRLLDAGKEQQLETILRPVASCLVKQGMSDAAAVAAATTVGIDANPACPGDIAYRLLTRLLLVGKKAPRLSHAVPSVSIGPTLLLFYETDCSNCESVLRDLCGFYPTLKDKNIRVISIASDDNEETFLSRATSLPWAIKWYEPQGFYSSDFESYGVAFTPTLVLVDSNGCVVGSYRTLEETTLIRNEL